MDLIFVAISQNLRADISISFQLSVYFDTVVNITFMFCTKKLSGREFFQMSGFGFVVGFFVVFGLGCFF